MYLLVWRHEQRLPKIFLFVTATVSVLSLTVLLSVEKRSFFRGELRDLCLKKTFSSSVASEQMRVTMNSYTALSLLPPATSPNRQPYSLSFLVLLFLTLPYPLPLLSIPPSPSFHSALWHCPLFFTRQIISPSFYLPLRHLHSLPIRFSPVF